MTDQPTGYLTLESAIRRAAETWGCEHEIAMDRLRRYLTGGSVKSKMRRAEQDEPYYQDISSETWASIPRHDIRHPIIVNKKDLDWLLDRLESGSHIESEQIDDAILLQYYEQISGPASIVPIGPLTDALLERERITFKDAFIRAIQASMFDDSELKYICKGQWSPIDSTNVRVAIEVAGSLATFERRYVMMAALPLASLTAWATKFDVPLPNRLRNNRGADHAASGPVQDVVPLPPAPTPFAADAPQKNDQTEASDPRNSETAGDTVLTPEEEPQLWRRKPGAQTKYDWPGMYRHLLACDKKKALDLKAAHTAAAEFFDAQDKYPSRLPGKVIELFREASGIKSLRDVLIARLKKAET